MYIVIFLELSFRCLVKFVMRKSNLTSGCVYLTQHSSSLILLASNHPSQPFPTYQNHVTTQHDKAYAKKARCF